MADMNDQCVICSRAMDSGMSSGTDDEDDLEVYRDSDGEDTKPLLSKNKNDYRSRRQRR